MSSLSTLNHAFMLGETALNVIGYLPQTPFPDLKNSASDLRFWLGKWQVITSLAVTALSYSVYLLRKEEMAKKLAFLSAQYIAHGGLNMARSQLEKSNWQCILIPYDIYNHKFLTYPGIAPQYDLSHRLFVCIKDFFDNSKIENLIPSLIRSIVPK